LLGERGVRGGKYFCEGLQSLLLVGTKPYVGRTTWEPEGNDATREPETRLNAKARKDRGKEAGRNQGKKGTNGLPSRGRQQNFDKKKKTRKPLKSEMKTK